MEYYLRVKDGPADEPVFQATTRFHAHSMPEVVEQFRNFLLGAGFVQAQVDANIPDPWRDWEYTDEEMSGDVEFEADETLHTESNVE